MDYGTLVQELSSASLFDVYRLRRAIQQILDDPAKIDKVKARLQPGMTISYFDESENRLVEAKVLELNRTRLLVENVADKKLWHIYYHSVNLQGVNVDIPTGSGKSDRSVWKVGDPVGFKDRQNRDVYGTITSLNRKTASVLTKNNQKWRIGYGWLFQVWEGEAKSNDTIHPALPMREKTLRVIEACEPDEG